MRLNQIKTRVLGDDDSLTLGKPAPDPYILAAKNENEIKTNIYNINRNLERQWRPRIFQSV